MSQDQNAPSSQDEVAFTQSQKGAVSGGRNISALSSVPVDIQVILGGASIPISNVLKLGRGAVVEVDRKVGDPVDIQINQRLVARGEVVIVDESRLGVTLTEIIGGDSISL